MANVLFAIQAQSAPNQPTTGKLINLTHIVEIAPAHNQHDYVIHLINGHKHFVKPAVKNQVVEAIEAFYA